MSHAGAWYGGTCNRISHEGGDGNIFPLCSPLLNYTKAWIILDTGSLSVGIEVLVCLYNRVGLPILPQTLMLRGWLPGITTLSPMWLNITTLPTCAPSLSCWGPCRTFDSIPGLYPRDANRLSSSCDNQKYLHSWPHARGGSIALPGDPWGRRRGAFFFFAFSSSGIRTLTFLSILVGSRSLVYKVFWN